MNQIIDLRENELPLTHSFSDNVYVREIFMPKGSIVVGHVHSTTHLNIASTGKAKVWVNGKVHDLTSPCTFESKAGTRKVFYIEEDMFFSTIHVTDETDIDVLENTLIDRKASEGIDFNQLIEDTRKDLLCHFS